MSKLNASVGAGTPSCARFSAWIFQCQKHLVHDSSKREQIYGRCGGKMKAWDICVRLGTPRPNRAFSARVTTVQRIDFVDQNSVS